MQCTRLMQVPKVLTVFSLVACRLLGESTASAHRAANAMVQCCADHLAQLGKPLKPGDSVLVDVGTVRVHRVHFQVTVDLA
jgi:hypothetical protein